MRRIRYKIYLTTGAILAVEMLASDTTMGLSDACKQMKDGDWPIWLADNGAYHMAARIKVCVNPAHVIYVAAEEIEE